VWDKIKHNMGHYNSVRHEFLLVCTRGSCQPDVKGWLFDSVQSIERGKHSEKPVEFFDIIETLYTHGRRLQMYGRKHRDGWDSYGHVAELEAAE
jgi:N6-adenosine-specific RNA methylase IME4